MSFPDFMILGAAKCGTTSLHAWLDRHPDVTMSNPKEPLFFEAEHERGVEHYRRTCFAHWDGESLTGEARHRNLYLPYVPDRVAQTAPDARFIVVLRDPVARAHAHWWTWYSSRHERLAFFDAVRADLARIERGERIVTPAQINAYVATLRHEKMGPHRTYVDTGYYAEQLRRYIDRFGRERLHVILFERLVQSPAQTVRRLFDWLGVDPAVADDIPFDARNRANMVPWRRAIRWSVKGWFKRRRPEDGDYRPPLFMRRHRGEMSPAARRWLTDHYRPHNERLRELLNDPLPEWA